MSRHLALATLLSYLALGATAAAGPTATPPDWTGTDAYTQGDGTKAFPDVSLGTDGTPPFIREEMPDAAAMPQAPASTLPDSDEAAALLNPCLGTPRPGWCNQ